MKKQTKKELILKAARETFLEKGFEGTSLSEIIAKAQVTHSLLFHHFKNKEQLWQVVKNQVVEEGKKVVANFPNLDQPIKSFLYEMIDFASNFYKKNPDVVRILNWQRLINDGDKNTGISNVELWLKVVEHFKGTGEISKQIASESIVTYTLSVVTSLVLDPNPLLDTQEKKQSYINFVVNNLMHSYKNDKFS